MDEIKSHFSLGAESHFESEGRNDVLEQAQVLFGRVRMQKAEKSILINGPHWTGKTALLNEIEQMAKNEGYKTILIKAHEEKPLAALLVPALRKTLFEIDQLASTGERSRGLRVLKSFIGSLAVQAGDIDINLEIEPESGSADSGDLEIDLPILFEVVAETALEQQARIALLIDDVQYFNRVELGALIMAMHKLQQRQLPFVLVGTGLPTLPALMGNVKSYAERLFSFPTIGAHSS